VDDDVIGSRPDRAPRPRRSRPGLTVPAGLRRHSRAVAVVAVLLAVAGVVAISRAGVTGLPTAAPTPSPPPLIGEILDLAAGQHTIYAVASDCVRGCRPTLVASDDDGHQWTVLTLPGATVTAAVARSWTLSVSGVEDLLAIDNPAAGTVTVGNLDSPLQTRKVVAGEPVARVPAGREPMLRICAKPSCRTPTLEYLEPSTGLRRALATQPPFPPAVLGVGGSQLWVAGIDPRTRRYAVAVSFDDGAGWSTVPLPKASTESTLVPRIVPIPERNEAYFLRGYRNGGDTQTSYDIWVVPAPAKPPDVTVPPSRVRPDPKLPGVSGAVGLKDGRLLLDGPIVLSPDGTQDAAALPDVDSARYLLTQPMRGPHLLFLAEARRLDGFASVAISSTGNVDDWKIRPIVLPG
jgi:hypothetical protein